MKPTKTKTELALAYGMNYGTFIKYLKDIPELKLSTGKRILTPKQLKLIYEEMGEPPQPAKTNNNK